MAETPIKLLGRRVEGQSFTSVPPDDPTATEWRLITGGRAFTFHDIKSAFEAARLGEVAFAAGRRDLQLELKDLLGMRGQPS